MGAQAKAVTAVLALLLLGACRDEQAPAPAIRTREDPPGWWRTTCGDVQPLGVIGGHDLVPPRLVKRIEPRWPETRRRGVIIIETVLTDAGDVCAARILRGLDPALDRAALDAVRQWRFTPLLLDRRPRAAFYSLTVAVK